MIKIFFPVPGNPTELTYIEAEEGISNEEASILVEAEIARLERERPVQAS